MDGQDGLAMHAAAQEAIDRARVRRRPHADRGQDLSLPHPLRLCDERTPARPTKWPFGRAATPSRFSAESCWTPASSTAAELEELREKEADLAQEAADFAVASLYPAPEEALTDVFLPSETESYSEPGHPAPNSNVRQLNMVEALNEALHEEMERDPTVFIMGEDIGNIGGLFGVTGGLLERFGEERIREMPIAEPGYTGVGVGAAIAGAHPVVEIQVMDFPIPDDGPTRQPRRQAPLHDRWSGVGADGAAWRRDDRHRPGSAALAEPRSLGRTHSGPEGHHAQHAVRRQGPDEKRHSRWQPGGLLREAPALRRDRSRCRKRSTSSPLVRPPSAAPAMTLQLSPVAFRRRWPSRPPRRWPPRASRPRSLTCGPWSRSTWTRLSSRSPRPTV